MILMIGIVMVEENSAHESMYIQFILITKVKFWFLANSKKILGGGSPFTQKSRGGDKDKKKQNNSTTVNTRLDT